MKIKLWMATTLLATVLITSCSKKSGLSPEDTALIKGTDRGTFTGSSNDLAGGENENDLSPIGSTISGLGGEDGLMPQDPFWSDPDTIQNAERPFDPIFFGFDQYNIGTDERQKLQDIAVFMTQNPEIKILIEGYCDWKGTPAYNKSLGDRRATSVRDYLSDLGIDSSRIEIISVGDEMATPNADPTTAGLERKAHFLILRDS
ncbi:MAG: OmpA family protein [Opitutales bacterium]|jgi:peptidoglycan-associated lipoprotein|nr:OmpA family protein [Opitutales bacterium]